jgi:hypothetical protein
MASATSLGIQTAKIRLLFDIPNFFSTILKLYLALSKTCRIFAHGLASMSRNQQSLFNPLNLKHYEE